MARGRRTDQKQGEKSVGGEPSRRRPTGVEEEDHTGASTLTAARHGKVPRSKSEGGRSKQPSDADPEEEKKGERNYFSARLGQGPAPAQAGSGGPVPPRGRAEGPCRAGY